MGLSYVYRMVMIEKRIRDVFRGLISMGHLQSL